MDLDARRRLRPKPDRRLNGPGPGPAPSCSAVSTERKIAVNGEGATTIPFRLKNATRDRFAAGLALHAASRGPVTRQQIPSVHGVIGRACYQMLVACYASVPSRRSGCFAQGPCAQICVGDSRCQARFATARSPCATSQAGPSARHIRSVPVAGAIPTVHGGVASHVFPRARWVDAARALSKYAYHLRIKRQPQWLQPSPWTLLEAHWPGWFMAKSAGLSIRRSPVLRTSL